MKVEMKVEHIDNREEKLNWKNFLNKINELREEKASHSSQKKLEVILKLCEQIVEDSELMAQKREEFIVQLRFLWASCTADADNILKNQNPRDYQHITPELQSLAINFSKLIPLIKTFLPLAEQEKLFYTVGNIYRQYGFWIKSSKLLAGEGFPLDASPFLVNYYEAKLNQLTHSPEDKLERKKIIQKKAEEQADFLCHALDYMSDSKGSSTDDVRRTIFEYQELINNLVEEKLSLHKTLTTSLKEEIKIPSSTELGTIEAKIHKLSVMIATYIFQLSENLLKMKGFEPPRFCVIGTGSFSRKELSPTSDFDCAIIVDEINTPKQQEYFDMLLDLVIENIEFLPHDTLRIDFFERNYLKVGMLINTPWGLVQKTKGAKIIKDPENVPIDPPTFTLNWPTALYRSFTEKRSSPNLFESYIKLWHEEIGTKAEQFGKIILKKLLTGGEKDSLKKDLLRPVVFWAIGFSLIYNENYRSAEQLTAAYKSGLFPASTREMLTYLQNTQSVPKKVSKMASNLIKIFDYAMFARNFCQINGHEETFDSSDEQIQNFKKIIARSKEIAAQICDQPTITTRSTLFSNPFSKKKSTVSLEKAVESKEDSFIQDYLDLVGEDAIEFQFPQRSSVSDEKSTPQPEPISTNQSSFLASPEPKTPGEKEKSLQNSTAPESTSTLSL